MTAKTSYISLCVRTHTIYCIKLTYTELKAETRDHPVMVTKLSIRLTLQKRFDYYFTSLLFSLPGLDLPFNCNNSSHKTNYELF